MLNFFLNVMDCVFNCLVEIGVVDQGKVLCVVVVGGGCLGFQYEIDFDDFKDDDFILEGVGEKVVIDSIFLLFLIGVIIDFIEELIGVCFVIENFNVIVFCGCGMLFLI